MTKSNERLAAILKSKVAHLTNYFTAYPTISRVELSEFQKYGVFDRTEIATLTEQGIDHATVERLSQQTRIVHFTARNSVISVTLLSEGAKKRTVKISELEALLSDLSSLVHPSVRLKVLNSDGYFILIDSEELLVLKQPCFCPEVDNLLNKIGKKYSAEVLDSRQSTSRDCVRIILSDTSRHLVPSLCIEILRFALNINNETEVEWQVM